MDSTTSAILINLQFGSKSSNLLGVVNFLPFYHLMIDRLNHLKQNYMSSNVFDGCRMMVFFAASSIVGFSTRLSDDFRTVQTITCSAVFRHEISGDFATTGGIREVKAFTYTWADKKQEKDQRLLAMSSL